MVDSPDPGAGTQSFLTTRWSLVQRAGGQNADQAREALAALCEAYWYPLYAFVRKKGVQAEDAADVTQGFFARLLEKGDLARVAPERGRFRAFLLASIQHYLANHRDRERAQKRGGDCTQLSIDFADADARFARESTAELSPERAFERVWAVALLERCLAALEEEYRSSGRAEIFEALEPHLTSTGTDEPFAECAQRLGMTETAVKVAAHRLRKRYRARLREEIAQTVASEADVEDEIRDLFRALGS